MKKKVLVSFIIVIAVVLGYTFTRSKTANAPIAKNEISSKTSQQEVQKQAAPTTNNSNEKKPMGLEIKTTQEGTGERVIKAGDHIFVHYTGKLTNGTVFDSSVTRGVPFDFTIGQGMVIAGWEQGFIGAKVGEKRTLTIPAEMGYGSRDMGTIPANSTLIFDVEVISIQ
jgi:FKBP-type peptidyl-prolyl cis-trans isomerase